MPTRKINLDALKNIDEELIRLGKPPKEPTEEQPAPAAPAKRKRGRPRKNPLKEQEEALAALFDDEDDDENIYFDGGVLGEGGEEQLMAQDPEVKKRKVNKIGIINDLRKKLNAVGSGLKPHIEHEEDKLDAEIDLLNSEINARRGDAAVKQITLMLMPIIEQIVDRTVPKDKFDVTGLQKEVHDNWEILDEACKHISILHRDWFEVSPYAEWAKGVYTCAFSRNMKNQMQRKRMTERQDDNSESEEE